LLYREPESAPADDDDEKRKKKRRTTVAVFPLLWLGQRTKATS